MKIINPIWIKGVGHRITPHTHKWRVDGEVIDPSSTRARVISHHRWICQSCREIRKASMVQRPTTPPKWVWAMYDKFDEREDRLSQMIAQWMFNAIRRSCIWVSGRKFKADLRALERATTSD